MSPNRPLPGTARPAAPMTVSRTCPAPASRPRRPAPPAAGPGRRAAGWDDAGQPEDWQRAGSDASTAPYPALPAPARRGRGGPPRRRTGLLAAAAALLAAALAVTILTARPHARPAPRAAAAASSARPAASPSSRPAAPAATPAITRAAARLLLTRYVAANNAANQSRSTAELAQIEGGSSYQLDAGGYQFLTAADPANTGYQAFGFTPAAWYIPRLAGYPRWFAVYGTWSGTRSGPVPRLPAVRPVRPGPPLAAGPGAQPHRRRRGARPGDRHGRLRRCGARRVRRRAGRRARQPSGRHRRPARRRRAAGVAITGLQPLGDQQDQAFWAARVPRGTGDTDRHTATPYGVYALRTAAGGALVFYSLAATLTIVPPPGQPVTLKIPGYYSPAEPVTTAATVPYADQFAAWIGPRGSQAAVRVIAQNSGIAARA